MNHSRPFWILAAVVAALLLLTSLPDVLQLAQGAEPGAAGDELAAAQKECQQFEARLYVLAKHKQKQGELSRRQWRDLRAARRSIRKLGRDPGALERFRDYVALRICQEEQGDKERDPASVSFIEILMWVFTHPEEVQKIIDWIVSLFSVHWVPLVLLA